MDLKIIWKDGRWWAQRTQHDPVWWENDDPYEVSTTIIDCDLPQNTNQVKALIALACKAADLDVAKAHRSFSVALVGWACPNLDALYDAMVLDCLPEPLQSWEHLPTFGGGRPPDVPEVWSWDNTRMIIGGDMDRIRIVNRVL